jgi:hypothetical protein
MILTDIAPNVFHIIFDFLVFRNVYTTLKRINKALNKHSETYRCDCIAIRGDGIEIIMELKDKNLFRVPKSIRFSAINFTDERWKYMNSFDIDKIHYLKCDLNYNIYVPEKVKNFSIFFCENVDFKTIMSRLEKVKDTLDMLDIRTSQHIDSDEIKKMFSFNVTKLRLCCGKSFLVHDKIRLKDEDIKKLNMDKLQELYLCNVIFDESCSDLNFLKNHKLTNLCLGSCNINQKYLKNVITQSLIDLSLKYTNIDDSFIEYLQVLKKNNALNVKFLDISDTLITSACFDNLRSLELTSLAIYRCRKINNLVGFSCPTLTNLDLQCNNFCDDDIKHALSDGLSILNISDNPKLTDIALSHIQERKLRLSELNICQSKKQNRDIKIVDNSGLTNDVPQDGITIDGIIKYLSGMNLFSLYVVGNASDYQKIIESKVLQL